MPRLFALLFCLLLLHNPATLFASEPKVTVANVLKYPDVVYATHEKEELKLDLCVPKGDGPFPVIVCFHGGSWRGGSRKDLTAGNWAPGRKEGAGLLQRFAEQGFAAASVSYRLAPKHKFPAQIIDAKTSIRFLRSQAKKYNLDPGRFVAMGFSAGGHIAALLGTTDSKANFDGKLYPKQSSRVQAVVDFFGPTQLSLFGETEIVAKSFMVPLLGKECLDDPECYQRASPIDYVSKDDPPFLIIHGTADIIVPVIHSERFEKKLKANGVVAELITLSGRGHGWGGDDLNQSFKSTIDFLNKYLAKSEQE